MFSTNQIFFVLFFLSNRTFCFCETEEMEMLFFGGDIAQGRHGEAIHQRAEAEL